MKPILSLHENKSFFVRFRCKKFNNKKNIENFFTNKQVATIVDDKKYKILKFGQKFKILSLTILIIEKIY